MTHYRSTISRIPVSAFENIATVSNYPTGLMNLCKCGQVVLAPATSHERCK
jgi:hypothetical protein